MSDLLLEATRLDSLLRAAKRAARGHRLGDASRPEAARFLMDAEHRCLALQRALRAEALTWQPDPYRIFTLKETKERQICAPSFQDRVVHHALLEAMDPTLERYAIFDSYACRRGKGQHRALLRAQTFARGAPWALKMDIARYFASIRHDLLLSLVERRFRGQRLLAVLERIICVPCPGSAPGRGLPIGSLCSQHMANLYLGVLDHHLKDDLGVRRYLRYMDDFLLFGERAQLVDLRARVENFLHLKLDLEVNGSASSLQPVPHGGGRAPSSRPGICFLGFRVRPDRIQPTRSAWRRFTRKLACLEDELRDGHVEEGEVAARVESLFAHLSAFDSWRLRSAFLARRRAEGMDQTGLQPGQPGRLLEERVRQLARREPQQGRSLQGQRQPGLPSLQISPGLHPGACAPLGVGARQWERVHGSAPRAGG